ncbi:MAG: PQQ-dependent dehydrogenase, methanol/ethanol family [Pseudomonadota bacterium]
MKNKNKMQSISIRVWLVSGLILLAGCSPPSDTNKEVETATTAEVAKGSGEHISQVSNIDDEDIANADENYGDWLSYGRNYQEDRYSELDQIKPENLQQLGLAWTIDLGTKRGVQSTPLVVDGVMFLTGPWSVVWAIDVRTGTVIWKYDPDVPDEFALKVCCGVVNRGAAMYQGAVFIGTMDGRLVSLNAADGRVNWQVKTVPEDSFYTITGAPRIVNGRVLIGNGGAEFHARGYVSAYDAQSGELAWRFYTVPGDPGNPFEHADLADAAKTWTGEWWKQGGGGTVWDSIVHDPQLNLVYIGVGNGTHWNQLLRSPDGGDNLYLSSIVALDADSGEYRWHFQTTPGDTWDYTATQPIVLADLEIEGEQRKVLMQAPKNGFFYVIDRITGEFISGDSFVYQNWASGLDENGRPVEVPGARYEDGRVHWIAPSSHGGHNWFPMSYNRATGLVYIPTANETGPYVHIPGTEYGSPELPYAKVGAAISLATTTYLEQVIDPKATPPFVTSGRLIAYDPVNQEEVWGVDQPHHYNGGLLSTANGLLMQGDAEGKFSIRNASTGEVLWDYNVRSGAIASPVSYLVDGEQYISLAVGWGGGQGQIGKAVDQLHPGTLYTWKLGGTATAPATKATLDKPITSLETDASELDIGRGYDLFLNVCSGCHSLGTGGGAIPDLTRSADPIFELYQQILREGLLAKQGMPNLGEMLSQQEVENIRDYVLYHAAELRAGTPVGDLIVKLAGLQMQARQPDAATASPE